MPCITPCRTYIHIAFPYLVGPSSVVWSELGPSPPFHHESAGSAVVMCEVAIGRFTRGPKSLEVNPSYLNSWEHGSWESPLHRRSQILSLQYDIDTYTFWRKGLGLVLTVGLSKKQRARPNSQPECYKLVQVLKNQDHAHTIFQPYSTGFLEAQKLGSIMCPGRTGG